MGVIAEKDHSCHLRWHSCGQCLPKVLKKNLHRLNVSGVMLHPHHKKRESHHQCRHALGSGATEQCEPELHDVGGHGLKGATQKCGG